MRCLAILNRRIGLHLLEDPNRPTNHIIDRAKQLVQRLEALMQPLIQKSSQEVLVQFRNHMEKAFTLAIRTYVALRLNVSKCEYYWPKDIDERFIGLDPSETNMKPWLVTSPTITARLPEWENSKIDFRIPAEYCYYDVRLLITWEQQYSNMVYRKTHLQRSQWIGRSSKEQRTWTQRSTPTKLTIKLKFHKI